MRVVIATEGQGEVAAFRKMFTALETAEPTFELTVIHVRCQPDGPLRGIVRACEPSLKIAKAKEADLFVLVLDREQLQDAPGDRAARLQQALCGDGPSALRIEVVLKDRTFENWLIADLGALSQQPARYDVSRAMIRQVIPDKADRVVAIEFLKAAVKGRQYDKIGDAKKLVERLDLRVAAGNSRSLRHLLHVLGHVDYVGQCRRAAVV